MCYDVICMYAYYHLPLSIRWVLVVYCWDLVLCIGHERSFEFLFFSLCLLLSHFLSHPPCILIKCNYIHKLLKLNAECWTRLTEHYKLQREIVWVVSISRFLYFLLLHNTEVLYKLYYQLASILSSVFLLLWVVKILEVFCVGRDGVGT